MNKRYIAAGVIGAIGFLICLSAVSQAEFDGIFVEEFAARSVVGILLMAVSLPISGDITADDYARTRKKGRKGARTRR